MPRVQRVADDEPRITTLLAFVRLHPFAVLSELVDALARTPVEQLTHEQCRRIADALAALRDGDRLASWVGYRQLQAVAIVEEHLVALRGEDGAEELRALVSALRRLDPAAFARARTRDLAYELETLRGNATWKPTRCAAWLTLRFGAFGRPRQESPRGDDVDEVCRAIKQARHRFRTTPETARPR